MLGMCSRDMKLHWVLRTRYPFGCRNALTYAHVFPSALAKARCVDLARCVCEAQTAALSACGRGEAGGGGVRYVTMRAFFCGEEFLFARSWLTEGGRTGELVREDELRVCVARFSQRNDIVATDFVAESDGPEGGETIRHA